MTSPNWKPKRRGETYCAPACGRGCTITEYRNAERKALRLAARLSSVDTDIKGGRWKIRVHENLGWHWNVTKGAVTVYCYRPGSYSAFFNMSGPWGGNLVQDGKTAEEAIKILLENVREQLGPMVSLANRLGVYGA